MFTKTSSETAVEPVTASQSDLTSPSPSTGFRKGSAFWLTFIAVLVCTFVSALDLTAVSVALPTITESLHGGGKFVWIGSAYGLSSAAILPLSGRLADAFGRRPAMLASVGLFLIGSALAGASQNMNMLIAARTVQGIGSGGILNLSEIIVSDLVPLAERGMFMGIISSVWAIASGVGPPIGGVLAQANAWRWIFYVNLPLTDIAFVLVLLFLRVRTPPGTIRDKLGRLDIFGNVIIIASTTLALIGLTWGGVAYAWTSAHTLATMIIGLVLMGAFFVYEWLVPQDPSIPWEVVGNRTTVSAYIATFFHGIASTAVFYYLPVYFQACMGSSPLRSSVQGLPIALAISPFALAAGTLVQAVQKYRWVNVLAWALAVVGFALFSTLDATSSPGKWVGFQIILAAALGLLYTATIFPTLAPRPVSRTASALVFFSFARTFAQTWGVTIGSTVLQNRLASTLPVEFTAQFPSGAQIAYAAIPVISGLEEPLRTEVRNAFAASLKTVWLVMVGMSGAGVLSLLLMKEVPMQKETDATFGLDDTSQSAALQDSEKAAGATEKVAERYTQENCSGSADVQ